MALRKPSDFFVSKKVEENELPIVKSDNTLREELSKVESLSEQLQQLQQDIAQKVVKSDLESLVLSQINIMQENFYNLQNELTETSETNLYNFKQVLSNITQVVNNLVENEIPKYKKQITNNEVRFGDQLKEFKNEVEDKVQDFYQVLNEFNDVVQVIDTVTNIEKYIQEHHQDLITLRDEVFAEIEQIPVGNIQENIERLEKKIDFIRETYSKIDSESVAKEIIQEGLLNEPPETKNEDPLTPLNQNFVTIDQLQEHYRLFINRIQQQLSTLGGGGETRLEFLDDIDRTSAKVNGRFLKYDAASGKWIGALGGGGSQTLDDTLGLGNTSSIGMSVGVLTATSFYGDGSKLTGIVTSITAGSGISINQSTGNVTITATGGGGAGESYWTTTTAGIHTLSSVGIGTTAKSDFKLYVEGNAKVTGILTVGNQSVTINGSNNTIKVGSGVTIDGNTGIISASAVYIGGSQVSTFSGNYNDLTNKPNLSSISVAYASTAGISTYATSAGTATTATNLSDAANILTGTINKDRISTTNALTVLGDLYVSNNISFGGTVTQLNTEQLNIVDADIVLGIGTSFSPTDNTANHGGIAIASTEGSPLVNLNIVPGETNPTTYKKIMWFKGDTIGAGLTDAWLFNYAVGIGSTNVPNGVRLAVGNVKVTDTNVTATSFTGSLSGNATSATTSTYSTTAGVSTYASSSGIATYASTAGVSTYASTAGVSTYATTAGISTLAQGLTGTPNIAVGIVTATSYNGSGSNLTGIVTYITAGSGISINQNTGNVTITATGGGGGGGSQTLDQTLALGNSSTLGMTVGVTTVTNLNVTGIATIGTGIVTTLRGTNINYTGVSTFTSTFVTNLNVSGIATIGTGIVTTLRGTTLNYTGVSTFSSGPVLISSTGTATTTGTSSQPLQVTGGAYVSGSVGVGTTNPREKLDVLGGNIGIQGVGSTSRFYIQHNTAQNSLDFVFI